MGKTLNKSGKKYGNFDEVWINSKINIIYIIVITILIIMANIIVSIISIDISYDYY